MIKFTSMKDFESFSQGKNHYRRGHGDFVTGGGVRPLFVLKFDTIVEEE